MGTILTVVLYALLMALVLGVLVFVHEFGHFFAARRCGVAVKEFAIGMGPKLISWKSKKYDTQYALRLLPIGGFVSMVGEDEDSTDERAFCNQKVWKRIIIVLSGVFMNFVIGFLLMMLVVLFQGKMASTVVADFDVNATSSSQLQVGDEIIKVGNTSVHTGNELAYEILYNGNEPVDLVVIRNGEEIVLREVKFPLIEEEGAVFGDLDFKVRQEERSFRTVMKHTFFRSVSTVKMVFDSLVGLFSGRFGIESVSGPIGIAETVGNAASTSGVSFLSIVTILSINLGVVNLLPLPALDGGRFLFLVVEGIRRKPINRDVEGYINFIGMLILFAFMIFISFKDVFKLII